MKSKLTSSAFSVGLLVVGFFLFLAASEAQAKDLKFEATLIWATNLEKSPDTNHKPADGEVLRKLKELPLRWKNFFVVTNVAFTVPSRDSGEATLSEKCKLRAKHVDHDEFEVSLINKNKPVVKQQLSLPKGEMLVLGGNAPDANGWLVVIKRIE